MADVLHYVILFALLILCVFIFAWLTRFFARRAAPHPLRFRELWLTAFVTLAPLLLFVEFSGVVGDIVQKLLNAGIALVIAAAAAAAWAALSVGLRRRLNTGAPPDNVR